MTFAVGLTLLLVRLPFLVRRTLSTVLPARG